MTRALIVGCKGEVGSALYRVLKPVYKETYGIDIDEKDAPEGFKPDIMHVCIRFSSDFFRIVNEYLSRFQPVLLDICSTVPPGTTAAFGSHAVHSTTRGAHPHLDAGLRAIPKHISGPKAEAVARYYRKAGIQCVTDPNPATTEVLHLLNNIHYGVNLMFADEAARICRAYGVDYTQYLIYTMTHNHGFTTLGHASKVRSVLTPPGGRIGGHCVTQSGEMLANHLVKNGGVAPPLTAMLGAYNK